MVSATTPTPSPDSDRTVVDALRTGDDAAFGTLVHRYHTAMVAIALRYVHHELRQIVAREVRNLPAGQQAVITLRDIEEWTAAEVCEALDLSPGNQRVLLHRAHSRVRAALDRYLTGGGR
jgi:DNA-directed RNA polymerase specialized sigma24 family protein